MDAVVAVYSDWGIGKDGTQSFVLKADRAQFKKLTVGKTVIVGRRTLADFPGGRPLPKRRNIVISRQDIVVEGAETAHSVEDAVKMCDGEGIVIGGASIYRDFFPMLDRVFVTKIDTCPESDSYFPNLDSDRAWRMSECSETFNENGVDYVFAVYERVHK